MMRKTFAFLIAAALVASPVLANTSTGGGGGGAGHGGGGHGGSVGHGSVSHANSLAAIHARGAAHAVSARTADHGHHHHHHGTQTAYAAQNTGHWQPCYEASQVQVNNLCVGPQKVRVP